MRLNLHLLRMFRVVVEQQSFSKAAMVLCVSQPAVSKGIRELESQLDLPLIDRGSSTVRGVRGVVLTDSGRALYEHARGIFAMERVALEDIRDRVEARRGRLRVGASTTIAAYCLSDAVSRFTRQHPQIEFELKVGNTDEVSRLIQDGQIDVAFVEGMVDMAGVVATPWRQDPLQIVAATGALLARSPRAAALSAEPWLVREPGSGTRQAADALLSALGVHPALRIEIGSNEAIAQAVASGAGIAVLPAVVVADLVAVGRVRVLKVPAQTQSVRLLYRLELSNRPRGPALTAFLQQTESV